MKVDLLITGGQVFNVYRRKFEILDVAVIENQFAYVGPSNSEIEAKEVVDAAGKFIVPGFVDIHLHIESTMLTPAEFSQGIIVHGTTTAVTDPHEIANVFGLKGVQTMMQMPDRPADIFYGIPSSVPSTPFETTGGDLGPEEIRALAKDPKNLCLGEVMNFHDLASTENTKTKQLIQVMREERGRPIIEGHCPKLTGLDLQKFLFAGVDADHTQQTIESFIEKVNLGMFVELQAKSLSADLMKEIQKENRIEHCCLVTDDTMVDALYFEGHLSRVYRQAVQLGLPIEDALYLSTYTPARRMGLTDRGSIAPGKLADFLLVDGLEDLSLHRVYKNGLPVEVKPISETDRKFPKEYYHSVNLDPLKEEDLQVLAPENDGDAVLCRVMEMNSQSTFTEEAEVKVPIENNFLKWQDLGVALVAVFDRYTGKNRAFGFTKGACLKRGAVATTYAHDHHNLLVLGHSVEDILVAANRAIRIQGGMVISEKGNVLAEIPLPVAGILSDQPLAVIAEQMKQFRSCLEELGWEHHNPIMSLGTLSLPVSPALKISDLGLIDVKKGKIVSLFF